MFRMDFIMKSEHDEGTSCQSFERNYKISIENSMVQLFSLNTESTSQEKIIKLHKKMVDYNSYKNFRRSV